MEDHRVDPVGSGPGTAELAYPVETSWSVFPAPATQIRTLGPADAQERALRFAERLGENL